jgi:hypothetical protein
MTLIDGEYYTVNPQAIRTTLDVYGENVRKVVPIHSEEFGMVMTVWVGAMSECCLVWVSWMLSGCCGRCKTERVMVLGCGRWREWRVVLERSNGVAVVKLVET